ncbi:MAG: ATP-binding cassette domain-containing protein [Defluviitaleaceae bacterium]|nr:ATP-binding cassette domain-containing protein [Defluviitaleaceae bacterium]
MDTLLELKDIKKYFKTPGGWLHAVDGVSFSIDRGKTLGVVGESGCGKSTLGRVVLKLMSLTDGQIIFDGKNVTNCKGAELKELRKDMQMIFQDPYSSLNPRMTVSELIGEPLTIYRICKTKDEYAAKVKGLMDTVGLAQRLRYTYPHELDGGRRQRIGVARALALSPKFIVCDEPVSALDVSIQAQILNLMQDLQSEMQLTYIFITHDLSVVKHISDDICVMYLGHMVEKGPSANIFKNPSHPYTRALLSAIPRPKINVKRDRVILKGEITSPINPKPGCRFAQRCLDVKDCCMVEQPELKEISDNHFVACHLF